MVSRRARAALRRRLRGERAGSWTRRHTKRHAPHSERKSGYHAHAHGFGYAWIRHCSRDNGLRPRPGRAADARAHGSGTAGYIYAASNLDADAGPDTATPGRTAYHRDSPIPLESRDRDDFNRVSDHISVVTRGPQPLRRRHIRPHLPGAWWEPPGGLQLARYVRVPLPDPPADHDGRGDREVMDSCRERALGPRGTQSHLGNRRMTAIPLCWIAVDLTKTTVLDT